ncbi:MAG TPA: helix-turn-helix transcriptional regulator [Gemmatimonadaceae bacterium]|nr:helix-turn-helix transcriptional regulator [Gemmatimonadaceae bacterium]
MSTREHESSRARWPKLYNEFRVCLVEARELAGMTQREAAKALGRSQSFIAKSESGERRVDIIELAQFAAVYERPLRFFLPQSLR